MNFIRFVGNRSISVSHDSFQLNEVEYFFDGLVGTCGNLIAPDGVDAVHLRLALPENHYLSAVEIQNQVTDPALISVYAEVESVTPSVIQTTTCIENKDFKGDSQFNCTNLLPATFVLIVSSVNHMQICGDIILYGGGT